MSRKILFVLFLSLTLSGEGMITVTLVWTILEKGGSAAQLGLILALMSLVPFVIQKFSKRIRLIITNHPLGVFSIARLVGLIAVVVILILSTEVEIYSLYLLAGLFAVIFFLSTQSLEAYMSHLVIDGKLSSHQASSTLQTSVQIGAFGGNAIAGFILYTGGFNVVLTSLAITLGIGMFLPFFVSFFNEAFSSRILKLGNENKRIENISASDRKKALFLTIGAVALLTVQLASFNFLLPIIFHDVRDWNPMQYGFVSAAAGIGALVATIIGRWERFIPQTSFLLIAVFNILISSINIWVMVVMVSFSLGFVFNRNRITQRSLMFYHIKTKEEATLWTGRSALAFQFTKSVIPLLLVFPLTMVGNQGSGVIFAIIGIIVSSVMYIIYHYERKITQKEENLLQKKIPPPSTNVT